MQPPLARRRRWLVPEVVQTSGMDCGPAVLKCALAGYGIAVQYGRLREACQTDLDGTSIDTLETIANRLGLQAEQVMLPPDHLLLPQSAALPAILVVRQPDGATHFVLLWRRHGPFVQVMDPSLGRRWMTGRQLLAELFIHRQRVPAAAWREWAGSDEMRGPLAQRLRRLGLGRQAVSLIDEADSDPGWLRLARLDAALRMVQCLVGAGGVPRGAAAGELLRSLLGESETDDISSPLMPESFWSVRPIPESADGEEQLMLRGAVLVRIAGCVIGPRPSRQSLPAGTERLPDDAAAGVSAPLSPELAAALAKPDDRPLSKVWGIVRGAGWISLLTLLACLGLIAACAVLEALLLRGMLDLGHDLALVEQRLEAMGCFVVLGLGVILLEYRILSGLYRLGRRLETTLRLEFLRKIPRLHDRYFQSRPTSDMAERGHSLHQVRQVPQSAGQSLRVGFTLLITAGAIAWVAPADAWLAAWSAATAILLPLAFLPLLQGLDLRVRTHAGALTRFTFDALQGLAAVRAHGAQQAVLSEHEALLVEWARASQHLLRWRVCVDGLQNAAGIGLAAWLLMSHASQSTDATGVLLIAYWALNLPALGQDLAMLVHQYPGQRNVMLRALEPLGAPELSSAAESADDAALTDLRAAGTESPTPAVAIRFESVEVCAAGHTILESISLDIAPGSHVAIVGGSGAGKSSLVGLLLGWHRPVAGRVLVDGRVCDSSHLDVLRTQTVWVDPAVQLWNRSLLDNVLYGNRETGLDRVGDVVQQAELYDVLQRLPDGLQTALGEGGGLVSGGEGQRVRFGRGLARSCPRLVILDEPFRGLERGRRRVLLEQARRHWRDATLLCVTHDVRETLGFPRVLVLDGGQVVEDGVPAELVSDLDSRYRRLLDAEDAVRGSLWGSRIWRRLQLRAGGLTEQSPTHGANP